MAGYRCPRCGMASDLPGRCPMCGVPMVKEMGHGTMPGSMHDHHRHMMRDFRQRLFVSLILTVPVLALSPLIQSALGFSLDVPFSQYILLAFSSAIFLYGGYPFLKGMLRELPQGKAGMMSLIGIATSVAFGYSAAVVLLIPGKFFFWELATLIDVMLLGHWLEMRSVLGASRALEHLAELLPSTVLVERGGERAEIALEDLRRGDLALIRPGERIPADGIIREGRASLNESMLTGESRPVLRMEGSPVIGGSINGESAIKVEIMKTGRETYLSQIIEIVARTQESKSRMQGLADRAAYYLTIIGVGSGIVTFAFWLTREEFVFALERAVTVMVITCPHALGLAIPLVIAVSTALAARNGFLIRNRTPFERARDIDAVVFDKTGTLTEGRFSVTTIRAQKGFKEERLLRLAASLESQSEHSIGAGILREAERRGMRLSKVKGARSMPGRGMKGRIGRDEVMVVSAAYAKEKGFLAEAGGMTTVIVLVNGRNAGSISLEDRIREESFQAVDALRSSGIRVMMLTGDSQDVGEKVARELGLEEHFSQVLPQGKADVIALLQERGMRVAMVGDGINDAPALARSDLGIAIGAGTDVAIESADVVLVRDDPRDIPAIIGLSKATYGKMLQNLAWATGYNAIAIPLAAGILYGQGIVLSPAIGALLMSVSTVIVAINAKTLKLNI